MCELKASSEKGDVDAAWRLSKARRVGDGAH